MQCPNCKHATSNTAILQCSQCGEAFERGPLEEFQHLEYLADWLVNRTEISQPQKQKLLDIVRTKQEELRKTLLPDAVTTSVPAPVVEEKTAPIAPKVTLEPVPVVAAVTDAPPVSAQPAAAPASKPAARPKPLTPPKPQRPPVDWGKVLAEAATSGALLRALLYLGAFMIVISAAVLVIRFWNQFNPILQLVFIASIPLMFYAGGWLLRTRIKLTQAGSVLTGIGAILVAVDFAAVYQLSGLGQNSGSIYWLIAAVVCTSLYAFTAWRVQGEFFHYLTLLGGAGTLIALTRLPTPALALEWSVDSVTFAGMVMSYVAGYFASRNETWKDFSKAARYLSQILIPASVFYILFSFADVPILSAFVFAMVGYIGLAWKFPSIVFAYLALIASLGTVFFGLRSADVPTEWYALAGSTVALVYLVLGQGLQRARSESGIIQNYHKALNITGLILITVAIAGGIAVSFWDIWAGIIALLVATLDLVICAWLFKHARYTFFAASLFIIPFSLAIWQWFMGAQIAQPLSWLAVAWLGLALTYMGLGALLRKAESHASWLYLLAHGFTLFALGSLPLAYVTTKQGEWSYISSSVTLGLSVVLFVLSTILQASEKHPALANWVEWIPFGIGRSLFLWLAGLLFPIWIAVTWHGNHLHELWFGALLAGLGIAYIGIGQVLVKRAVEYRLAFHAYAYLLLAFGILIAIPNADASRYPLLTSLLVTCISLGLLAYIYNRAAETGLAGLLFIWSFIIMLDFLNVPLPMRGVAFIVLAALVYIPLGIYLRFLESKRKPASRFQHVPIFVIGYALSLYALYLSVSWSLTDSAIAWVGVTVPLLASALYVYSTSYFKGNSLSNIFAWVSVITFAIAFRAALTFFQSPSLYDSFAWIGLAAFYMVAERLLARIPTAVTATIKRYWFDKFHLPLLSGWIIVAILGFSLSLTSTLSAFAGSEIKDYLPAIISQVALVLLLIASARLYHTRIPLYIEPIIAFLATTFFFIGYGETLFTKPLTTPQYALTWTGLGIVHILAAILLDNRKVRYAHGLYVGGYALLALALAFSSTERIINIYVLTLTILVAIASYLLVHFGRHHSFEDFIKTFLYKTDETTRQITSTIFLFYAAYAIPVLLTQYLAHIGLDLAWRGVSLAILAPLYIATGLLIRRSRSRSIATAPTWALYSAGYALTAIGAMTSFGDEGLAIYVLSLNAIVYAVSAYIFRQSFWLYLTTVLAPIITLLTLHYNDRLETNLVAWFFIGFAFVYLAIGQLFDRMKTTQPESGINSFAAPFYMPGFLLSAISLALASNNRELAIGVYSAGVVLYALSSFLFKEPLFYYPAAWLAAVPYYLAITLTSLETRWYGLAWLPLILLYLGLGRFVFHKRPLAPLGKGFLADWLAHPSVPFYLLAYGLIVSMISLSYISPLSLTLAFGIAALLYFASAYIFRNPAWIYPALFTIHMTVLAYFTINPSGGPVRNITIPFLVMTWITSLVGYFFERTTPLTDENKTYRFSFLNRLFGHAWARPFFAFALIEMLIWQSLALTGYDTGIIVASGNALLLALFSLLWTEGALVYGAVAFSLLAVGVSLKQAAVPFEDSMAVYGGIGFGLYLLGRILNWLAARVKSLTVWLTPLTHVSITLTAVAALINISSVANHMTAAAATFAFAGALYVAIAYRGRMYRLGYLGIALLELAWVLALIINDVEQPQWYAIPGGLYFIGLGFLEWRSNKSRYAIALEILGYGVLMVTSFAQSLSAEGLPYFVLLMVEGLLAIWWGVLQMRRIPFFTGVFASAINIVAQVIVLISVYDINRWLVAFGVGLLIMVIAIYIERSREQLRARARELSETLEKWE